MIFSDGCFLQRDSSPLGSGTLHVAALLPLHLREGHYSLDFPTLSPFLTLSLLHTHKHTQQSNINFALSHSPHSVSLSSISFHSSPPIFQRLFNG
jgi:hypothetical protein